jgi:hypothetical protein
MERTTTNKRYEKRRGPEEQDREQIDPKKQLNVIMSTFLERNPANYNEIEVEAKFGTRGVKPITKIDYDNVIKKLLSLGYTIQKPNGTHLLRIQLEFLDAKTGKFKTTTDIERFRVEISGLENISEYCKNNNIGAFKKNTDDSVLSIIRKQDLYDYMKQPIKSANFDDFNFRVTIKNEETISKRGKIATDLFEKWQNTKKVFRYINRIKLKTPTIINAAGYIQSEPYEIEMSIIRSSTKSDRGWMIPTYNVDESNVFQNPETYEIEVEVSPFAKGSTKTANMLCTGLQTVVKHILCGLQRTNYPISYVEQRNVLKSYHKLLFEEETIKRGEEYVPKDRLYGTDFIGPNLVTLSVINIAPLNPDVIVPNITEPYSYCVTEKADGDRHMLFINETGKIYLINTNMSIIFTGAKTNEEKCFNSLLDGELILHNKRDEFINIFAAFDIYYVNGNDVRARPFVKTETKDEEFFKEGCRLPLLKDFIRILKAISISFKKTDVKQGFRKLLDIFEGKDKPPINITSKNFYPTFGSFIEGIPSAVSNYNIFDANNYLLRCIADNIFDYEIDGLIFTPTLLGVGSNKFLEAGPKKKITWPYNFKWKPSVATRTFPKGYNTIDFLVITKKGPDGKDVITPIFENGINNYESTQYNQFKTLILAVGFDQTKHGYINPCQDVLDDKFTNMKDMDDESGYKPKQFFPSNPFDPLAGLCNVMLEQDSNGTYQLFTEERQVFDDQMVVEFRYDMDKQGLWKWIPMRVRYDKTAEFKANRGVGANDYNTANNNWTSIHNPVTEQMIATGETIPGIEVSDDVYYNSMTTDKMTQRMRDFHNLYVKKALIHGVSKKSNILIDFACGKAGDLPKWIGAELSFVLGIDISKDNIENRLNGACARFLNFKKTTKNMPYALFINGNSSLNIRSGINMFDDKANQIVNSVFGTTGINKSLGPAVSRQHGKAHSGFDVSSCQFAIHYMFENRRTFYNFIRNVAECTKLNGYFIATCYDGQTIFNMLRKKQEGESREIYIDDKKIWSVTKSYDAQVFEDNESSLGYKIDVYQDSINQTLSEYLVNFDFLTSTMDKYGFKIVSREEARYMGLPEGSGMFSELFHSMMNEIKRDPKKETDYKDASYMENYEKDISFLNRFFIYKKISTRNAEKLTKSLLDQLPDEIEFENDGTMLAQESVKKAEELIKPKAKNLRRKLVLEEATEAFETLSDAQRAQREIENRDLLQFVQYAAEERKDSDTPETKKVLKSCPDDKELNPTTQRCVNKCEDDKVRNEEFKCVKPKKTKKTKDGDESKLKTRKTVPKTKVKPLLIIEDDDDNDNDNEN